MFNEHFFDHLDRRVEGFLERTGEPLAAVVLRTRWGMFNVAKVRAEEVVLGLSVYAGPGGREEADDGIGTAEDGAAPPADDPPVDDDEPRKCAEMYIPYGEVISVELYPGSEATAYLGGELGGENPLIGFGRS